MAKKYTYLWGSVEAYFVCSMLRNVIIDVTFSYFLTLWKFFMNVLRESMVTWRGSII